MYRYLSKEQYDDAFNSGDYKAIKPFDKNIPSQLFNTIKANIRDNVFHKDDLITVGHFLHADTSLYDNYYKHARIAKLYVGTFIKEIPKNHLCKILSRHGAAIMEVSNFTVRECILYFGKYVILSYLQSTETDTHNIWLTELKNTKYNNIECIVQYLVNHNDSNILRMEVAKMYEQHDIVILNILSNEKCHEVYTKIYNMDPVSIINTIADENNIASIFPYYDKFTYIITKYKTLINNFIFYYLFRKSKTIWDIQKNYNDQALEIAFKEGYHDIIIEFMNNDDFASNLNINKLLTYLLIDNFEYNSVINVFKNCKNYNILEILDLKDERYKKLNYKIPELLLSLGDIVVDINLIKKFFRINCYIKDLDKFKLDYSLELYNLCNNYSVYPEEYMSKFPIDKNILHMRQYFYNNKSPNIKKFTDYITKHNLTPDEFTIANYACKRRSFVITEFEPNMYTMLRSSLFRNNKITKADDEILLYLNSYLKN